MPFRQDAGIPQPVDFWDRNIFRDDFVRPPRPRPSWCGGARQMIEVERQWVDWVKENIGDEQPSAMTGEETSEKE